MASRNSNEPQVLGMDADGAGRASENLAIRLGISERTIQFRFDGIRSKIGAANRRYAIARV